MILYAACSNSWEQERWRACARVLLLHLLLSDAQHASLAMRKRMTDYVLSYAHGASRPSDAELREACASLDRKMLPAFDPPNTHDNDVVRFINGSVLNAIPKDLVSAAYPNSTLFGLLWTAILTPCISRTFVLLRTAATTARCASGTVTGRTRRRTRRAPRRRRRRPPQSLSTA